MWEAGKGVTSCSKVAYYVSFLTLSSFSFTFNNKGDEAFKVPVHDKWIVNVDCAGFVRQVLKHVTKNPFVLSLSDRDFMRAKDFFEFFSTIPFTVLDGKEFPESARLMKWRNVPDLRMVIRTCLICSSKNGPDSSYDT